MANNAIDPESVQRVVDRLAAQVGVLQSCIIGIAAIDEHLGRAMLAVLNVSNELAVSKMLASGTTTDGAIAAYEERRREMADAISNTLKGMSPPT